MESIIPPDSDGIQVEFHSNRFQVHSTRFQGPFQHIPTMVVGGDGCRRDDGAAGGIVEDGGNEGRGVLSVVDDTKLSVSIC